MMLNTIYLRRKYKLIVPKGTGQVPDTYVATFLKNLEHYGFTFSATLLKQVRTLSKGEFLEFTASTLSDITSLVGEIKGKPMYPNFPKQVMEMEESTLYLNALLHYWTLQLPQTEVQERVALQDDVSLQVIDLGNMQDFNKMIQNLISARTSISDTDKEDVKWAILHSEDIHSLLPSEIPIKENASFIGAILLKNKNITVDELSPYIKTATDVLRLATSLSDGDVSLATNTKFKKFKRRERRALLALLEQCSNIKEDMLRYKKRWIRLGEILHPSEYKKQFPKCQEAFTCIRNNQPVWTFGRELETALVENRLDKALALLEKRPGEYARRLDHLLRITDDHEMVLQKFTKIASSVATTVLLQVKNHFTHRNESKETRIFFPKGNVARYVVIPNHLPTLASQTCELVIQICKQTLLTRFSTLPSLGNVFIASQLKDYTIPFSQRSASKSLHTISRGSKMDMQEGNTIRFFTWWQEGNVNGKHTGYVDIDLSAVIYDEDWQYQEHISFTNLKSSKFKAYHSGDITTAPEGACEFIDIDISSVQKNRGRYVVMSLLSYSSQPFANLPVCFAGWMMRQYPNTGEIFEPATVHHKIDLASDTQICIPVIFDLVERKVIWTDMGLKQYLNFENTIENNQRGFVQVGKAFISLPKPNLYDLFLLHGQARGVVIDAPEKADLVFAVDEGITPYDMDIIMSEFLS